MKSEKNILQTIKTLGRIRQGYPLALARLWVPHCHRFDGLSAKSDRPRGCGQPMVRTAAGFWKCEKCDISEQRTSQIEIPLSFPREAFLVAGGNRAGKTQLGAQMAVAFAAGRQEWWVKQWASLNNIPLELLPPEPSTVLSSGLSYADSAEYIRPKILEYLPQGCKFRNWSGAGRSTVTFPNGGRIIAMSADSGREKYQGMGGRGLRAISLAWLDEEHPEPIFEECLLRCTDTPYGGKILLTMTPLKGMTWVHSKFIEKQLDGFGAVTISGLDNPFVSSVKLRRATQHLSKESQDSRLYGAFTTQAGLIYQEFTRQTHVIPSRELPVDWPRYRGIDFGVRNPFCCLWVAHDEDTDTLHVYREYLITEKTTLESGRVVYALSKKDPAFAWTSADPESKDGRLTLARYCNIPTKPAPKHLGVHEGIQYVKHRLMLDAEGTPALVVHDCCKHLIREFRLYRWKPDQKRDQPIKRDDHALDALRYICMTLARQRATNDGRTITRRSHLSLHGV
jgi:phage terminase large subunit-like protein